MATTCRLGAGNLVRPKRTGSVLFAADAQQRRLDSFDTWSQLRHTASLLDEMEPSRRPTGSPPCKRSAACAAVDRATGMQATQATSA